MLTSTIASHPNIVPVFDYGQTNDGRCFVVSKLIEGASLRERMSHWQPSFEESATLIATLSEALQYAHSKRLVHRDIKPANVLMDEEGMAFITDFGLAIRDIDLGDRAFQGGTPAYMSPEQARGEGHRVDPRSDILSLGVMLYELLTGQRPFAGSSPQDVMDRIRSPDLDAWLPSSFDPDVPKDLERICLRCLSKRAADRYPQAQALADDLRHFLSEPRSLAIRGNDEDKAVDVRDTARSGWHAGLGRYVLGRPSRADGQLGRCGLVLQLAQSRART